MSSSVATSAQYTRHSILRYEKIFGEGFVSTGGTKVTASFCDDIDFTPGFKVLDIGSGLGGAAFYMADKYGASVEGIDISPVMLEIANERAQEKGYNEVRFKLDDIRTMAYEPSSFDLVWSRDTLLHIPEKQELFEKVHNWLGDGGQVMITDYARNTGGLSNNFQQYVSQSGYDLHDLEGYGELFKKAGFQEVIVEDWTEEFMNTLKLECEQLQKNREHFLDVFTESDLDYLLERWQRKIVFCEQGDMKAGKWRARSRKS